MNNIKLDINTSLNTFSQNTISNSTMHHFTDPLTQNNVRSLSNLDKTYLVALTEYKKLCQKVHITENQSFINILKQENLNISPESYNLKEINIISKIIGSFYYFNQIVLSYQEINSILFYK